MELRSLVCVVLLLIAIPCYADDLPRYIGAGSCSTVGCHGNPGVSSQAVWRSAFVIWADRDPHARSADALFNERSARMVDRLLSTGEETTMVADAGSVGAEAGSLRHDDQRYRQLLESRCIGCHATPAAATSGVTYEYRPNHLGGVSCESCHGAASRWLEEHTTHRWNAIPRDESSGEKRGQRNTADLFSRAAICVECHVGPFVDSQRREFFVDHELIAAGHPRLSFEFSAFLANLPAHWDETRDQNQDRSGMFHSTAWRFGQLQQARQQALELARQRRRDSAGIELANYDCFRCHHALRGTGAGVRGTATTDLADAANVVAPIQSRSAGWPPPEDGVFLRLEGIARRARDRRLLPLVEPLTQVRMSMVFPGSISQVVIRGEAPVVDVLKQLDLALGAATRDVVGPSWSVGDHCALLSQLADDLQLLAQPRWESSLQLHLAVTAFVEDHRSSTAVRIAKVAAANGALGAFLSQVAASDGAASIYQSPTRLTIDDVPWRNHVQKLSHELQQLLSELPHAELPPDPQPP